MEFYAIISWSSLGVLLTDSLLLQFYRSGVYDSSRCSSSSLNHAMVVTGYGTYGSKDYWLVKNR